MQTSATQTLVLQDANGPLKVEAVGILSAQPPIIARERPLCPIECNETPLTKAARSLSIAWVAE